MEGFERIELQCVVLTVKLTFKLVLVVLAVTVFVLSLAGYLRVQREVDTFQSTMVQDGRLLGQIVGGMVADSWKTYGQRRVIQLLEDANASTQRFHFSWIPPERLATTLDRVGLDQQQRETLWRGERVVTKTQAAQGQATLSTYAPVMLGNGVLGVVEIVESLADMQHLLD
jgi:hypothetical protein